MIITSMVLMFIFNNHNGPLYVNIFYNSELVGSYPLVENRELTYEAKISEVKVLIKDGYVSVIESGCPDHICINMGKKNNYGDTITCLPNLFYVRIGDIFFKLLRSGKL